MNELDKIIKRKQEEVDKLIHKTPADHPLNRIRTERSSQRFSTALKQQHLTLIAEVKRRSPSVGEIGEIDDPARLALQFCQGGASAISVLTDFDGFGGSLCDLQLVSKGLAQEFPHVPILRKDFILHPLQLAEAVLAGASAVLLIAAILGPNLKNLIQESERIGLETLTEVHDFADLEIALEAGAPMIGVNHRNLKTFEIDLSRTAALRPHIPDPVVTVAESGIHAPEQARQMRDLGYDAILMGEALVRSKEPGKLIARMKGGIHES